MSEIKETLHVKLPTRNFALKLEALVNCSHALGKMGESMKGMSDAIIEVCRGVATASTTFTMSGANINVTNGTGISVEGNQDCGETSITLDCSTINMGGKGTGISFNQKSKKKK